jgi:enamine deaminase RidA (YjgF/YER057c/UK114 family)
MAEYFEQPYPARAAIGVAQLPKDANVEMDGVLELES